MDALASEANGATAERLARVSPTLTAALLEGLRQGKPVPGKAAFEPFVDPTADGGQVWALSTAWEGWPQQEDGSRFLLAKALAILGELVASGDQADLPLDRGWALVSAIRAPLLSNACAGNSAIRAKVDANPRLRMAVALAEAGAFDGKDAAPPAGATGTGVLLGLAVREKARSRRVPRNGNADGPGEKRVDSQAGQGLSLPD